MSSGTNTELSMPDTSNGAINGHATQKACECPVTTEYNNHMNEEVTSMHESDGYVYMDASPTEPLLGPSASDEDAEVSRHMNFESGQDDAEVTKQSVKTVIGDETSLRIALQVFFPYLIAGFGMVGAGAVLEIVKVCSGFFVNTLMLEAVANDDVLVRLGGFRCCWLRLMALG